MSDEPVAAENPQDLLAQMERMLTALSADLVQLDAELQPSAPRPGDGTADASFISGADQA